MPWWGKKNRVKEIRGVGRTGWVSFLNLTVKAGLTEKTFERRLEKSERVLQTAGGMFQRGGTSTAKALQSKYTWDILRKPGRPV